MPAPPPFPVTSGVGLAVCAIGFLALCGIVYYLARK